MCVRVFFIWFARKCGRCVLSCLVLSVCLCVCFLFVCWVVRRWVAGLSASVRFVCFFRFISLPFVFRWSAASKAARVLGDVRGIAGPAINGMGGEVCFLFCFL